MKIKNILSIIKMAASRIYWCIKKGFPLRLALCDIPFKDVPASTYFGHPYGITIGKGTVIGENCIFASNVTIGSRRPFDEKTLQKFHGEISQNPAIVGNNVFFGAGCVILGAVKLNDNYIVGANEVIKG